MALILASGLVERGYQVDLVLRDLVCDYPEYVPANARLFFLSQPKGAEDRSESKRLPIRPRSLIQGRSPIRVLFPRFAFTTVAPLRLLPLLTSTSLPHWAAATSGSLDRERPDALLAILNSATFAATLASCIAHHRVHIVASQHNIFISKREFRRARRSFPYVDAAVAVSLGVADELSRLSGMPHSRIHAIYNPVVPTDLDCKSRESIDHPWLARGGSGCSCYRPTKQAKGLSHPAQRLRLTSETAPCTINRAWAGTTARETPVVRARAWYRESCDIPKDL